MAAEFCLVAVSGSLKGRMWELSERPVLLGRDADCDASLDDAVVSRKHCRLFCHAGQVHYEDLGSLNLALINRHPQHQAVLHPGDEIAIGHHCFILTGARVSESPPATPPESPDTLSFAEQDPIVLQVDTARQDAKARPGTIQDFVLLYENARHLSRCTSVADLVKTLCSTLDRRFHPLAAWIALVHGEEDMIFLKEAAGTGDPFDEAPQEALLRCLREGEGLLVPALLRRQGRRLHTLTMMTPMRLGESNLGVIVLRTAIPHGLYGEEDLRMLVLLGQSVAPILAATASQEQLRRDNALLRARAGASATLAGASRPMQQVRTEIRRAARTNLHVLVTGETGTGKELAARMLHAESPRAGNPFVVVNCAAIPRELFESEIFGYERGAFTGAEGMSPGLMTQAHGGVLFLDEIGDLSLENQARILRAAEQGTFRRIGAQEETRADVRIVAATNRNLRECIQENRFREDLYHRLNGFEIVMPPLRDRISDVPLLAHHFLDLAKEDAKRPLTGFSKEAISAMEACRWPGNVRELRNAVFRAAAIARGAIIQDDDIAKAIGDHLAHHAAPLLTLKEMEQKHIEQVLDACAGNVREAARVLGLARSTLYAKLGEYGLR